ncbi:acetyl-CoA carboxylase, carboxyltransferase subunit beta [Saccharomonospora sp.]|uniref:acetyl-CoA carboxylase, carboxyltransferase subunit beta n=1 Tax=Saccharomonospora sp. TaxID=33913 RepID=UPI0026376B08|nr:acetyl-CoA carboxylase, carboxyltransferase subunit beta [Saccharomonospora sp.]
MTEQLTPTSSRLEVEVPEEEPWLRCPGCGGLLYRKRFVRLHRVCPDCGNHARLTARQRIEQLLDPDSAHEVPLPPTAVDPLRFTDSRPYPRRLAEARSSTGEDDAVVVVTGRIGGHPLVVAVMDFGFLGGSLGVAAGEAVTCAAELALRDSLPLLLVTASGGARMQEGVLSLMQMAKTAQAMAALDEAGLLTITLVTDPTYGGVAASFATLSDVLLAEPGARLGFAGPRVIKQTINQELPEGFQTAEFLRDRGLIDGVHPRAELRQVLTRLLDVTRPDAHLSADAECGRRLLVREPARLGKRSAWETVRLARAPERLTTLEHIRLWTSGFVELLGSRCGSDSPALVGGVGLLSGQPVLLLGHQKGHDTHELVQRDFGMVTADGYRKVLRLLRLARKLRLPVVSLIDTPGAHPGLESEETGQAGAIAACIAELGALPVPVVSVITGEGGSGGALALAVSDRVLLSEHAVYSVISAEGCAAILWKTAEAAPKAAEALQLDAPSLLRHGIVDAVVPEPGDGAHTDPMEASTRLRDAVLTTLSELLPLPGPRLVRDRRARYRAYGRVQATALSEGRQR